MGNKSKNKKPRKKNNLRRINVLPHINLPLTNGSVVQEITAPVASCTNVKDVLVKAFSLK